MSAVGIAAGAPQFAGAQVSGLHTSPAGGQGASAALRQNSATTTNPDGSTTTTVTDVSGAVLSVSSTQGARAPVAPPSASGFGYAGARVNLIA